MFNNPSQWFMIRMSHEYHLYHLWCFVLEWCSVVNVYHNGDIGLTHSQSESVTLTHCLYKKIYFIFIFHIQYMSSIWCKYFWHNICTDFGRLTVQKNKFHLPFIPLPTGEYFHATKFLFTALYSHIYITLHSNRVSVSLEANDSYLGWLV